MSRFVMLSIAKDLINAVSKSYKIPFCHAEERSICEAA